MNREKRESWVEPMARALAAEKMGLEKDPMGEKLPEELWRQKEQEVRDFLGLTG